MPPKRSLRKAVDEITPVGCAAGRGLIREEVWQDADGEIARYNLAFINHFMMRGDNAECWDMTMATGSTIGISKVR